MVYPFCFDSPILIARPCFFSTLMDPTSALASPAAAFPLSRPIKARGEKIGHRHRRRTEF